MLAQKISQSLKPGLRWKLTLRVIGLIIGLFLGIVSLISRPRVINYTNSFLKSLTSTIRVTQSGLELIGGTLDGAETSLQKLGYSLDALKLTVDNLVPMVSDISELVGKDLVSLSEESQTTIKSATESAKVIDATLEVLTKIPLLRLDYKPDIPLHTSLENVSTNIKAFTPVLQSIQLDLDQSASDIAELSTTINDLSVQMKAIKTNLSRSTPIIQDYQRILVDTLEYSENLEIVMPRWLNLVFLSVFALLLWFFFWQLEQLLIDIAEANSGKIRTNREKLASEVNDRNFQDK